MYTPAFLFRGFGIASPGTSPPLSSPFPPRGPAVARTARRPRLRRSSWGARDAKRPGRLNHPPTPLQGLGGGALCSCLRGRRDDMIRTTFSMSRAAYEALPERRNPTLARNSEKTTSSKKDDKFSRQPVTCMLTELTCADLVLYLCTRGGTA